MTLGREIFLTPIVITSSNNSFYINENAAGYTAVTVTAGTYYLYYGTEVTGYASFYNALATVLDAALAGATSFSAVTPTESTDQDSAGLRIKNDTHDFSIDFDHASFTMDPRWFGFRVDKGSMPGTNIQTSSGTALDSDFTVLGHWYSANCVNDLASRKHIDTYSIQKQSTRRASDSAIVRWHVGKLRDFLYEDVPGAHVHGHKADDATAAANAKLATNDVCNAFDLVADALDFGQPIIVVYNQASPSIAVTTQDYEVVKFTGSMKTHRQINPYSLDGMDLYNLSFVVEVLTGTFETLADGDYMPWGLA